MTDARTPAIQDQAQRRAALDPASSFIVQAPAGSGKTELLIQRYLTLLATVEFPEAVIAVTFTRKAAGEMRHRIVEALRMAIQDPPPTEEHKRQTWELCRRVLVRDREREWQLISHPSRMRIQTIDSLCGMFVGQMPWLSRMGAGAAPEDKAEHLYREAARITVELLRREDSHAAAVERLLRHLDNNVGTAESLLTGMLRSRDHWLRHIVPNRNSANLRSTLEAAMRQIISDELEFVRLQFPKEFISETLWFANFAAHNLEGQNSSSSIVSCKGLDSLPGAGFENLTRWRGLAELLIKKDGGRRLKLDVNTGFPSKPDCKAEKKRCLELPFSDSFLAALHGLRMLPPPEFSESQWEVLSALIDLLPIAAAQLKVVFQSEGRVDFTEVAQAASRALGTRDNPTDLAFSLDCRIQHLLVDEFQDTSQSQFELLEKLTSEWEPGDGRTLFLVGDPMQSIYGFREAEVALFMKARDRGVSNIRLIPLELSVNFRSNVGIVSWVNSALGEAFPANEDMFRGAVTYKQSVAAKTEPSSSPAVEIHPFFDNGTEAEAGVVVEIIRKAREERQDGTIAVIVRARTHLPAIVNALRSSGERFMAVEIDSLGTRAVVQDLLALTAALLHFGDRTAWLSILRAPWCGLTLADLQSLVGNDFHSPIWELLNDDERLAQLSVDGRSRVDRLKPILAAAIAERGRLPLRRWIEAAWMALGGPACLDDPTGLEDAAAYLDLLEVSSTGMDLRDPERFLSDVNGLFARPDAGSDGTLQLLTVHKAKGLEFDTVILPGLGRYSRSDSPRLLLWLEYMDRSEKAQLLLAPIKESGTESDAAYAYVRKVQSAKSANESLRLLYVAATRARSKLHLLGHTEIDLDSGLVQEPGSRTLLRRFWPAAESIFQAAAGSHSQEESVAPPVELPMPSPGIPLRRLSLKWQPVPPPPEIEWRPFAAGNVPDENEKRDHVSFDWATDLQRHVGTVVHVMLQNAVEGEPLDARSSTVSAALSAQGLYGDRLRQGILRAEKALRAMITDERGKWILRQHEEDQREYALCGLLGNRVRHFKLDRTFVDGGVRWIIDYKTGSHEGGNLEAFLNSEQERYRPQLEDYARLMSRLDSRPIRLGLYFPLLQAWREWS